MSSPASPDPFSLQPRGPLTPELGSWIPVAIFGSFLAMTLGQILAFNEGVLVYNMDDPYIGYALAEEIARGNYGINPGEATSPASTLLWPFLLAPFILLPGSIWLPFLINAACVLLVVHAAYGSLAANFREVQQPSWRALATGGALISTLLLNLTFVTFAGMEHGPQVLLAVLVGAGLIEWLRTPGRSPSKLLVIALWVGPLIRFEALALTVPALVLLWHQGYRRHATAIAVGAFVPIAAFVAFLTANGIGPLPSSLMVRAPQLTSGGFLGGVLSNGSANLLSLQGLVMATIMVPVLGIPFDRTRVVTERWLGAWLVTVVVLHFCFGQFGYWGRYESYIWATVLIMESFLMRRSLARWVTNVGVAPAMVIAALLVSFASWPYARDTLKTPLASNDIYIEHREINRLLTEYVRAPVAVNDVGYVSFRNDFYVLDLFGLTSHDVRAMRVNAGADVAWMETLVRRHDADLAMVYLGPGWFTRIPTTWTPLGRLQIEREKALLPVRAVTLFATRSEAAPTLRDLLAAWGEGLPQGARVDLVGAEELGLEITGAAGAANASPAEADSIRGS